MSKIVKYGAANDRTDSFANDLALLAEAITDAFRDLTPAARVESRWSRLRECGRSFGSGC